VRIQKEFVPQSPPDDTSVSETETDTQTETDVGPPIMET